MNELRNTILAEEEIVATKRRFALFSQPPPLAVGDDGEYKKLQHPRGENGKPITKPPQMLAGTCRAGQTKSSYFSQPDSIHSGDPFKEEYKRDAQFQMKYHTRASFHETEFKPGSGHKILDRPSYKYTEERPVPKKYRGKDDNGKVITDERNVTTNPSTKVENDLLKPWKYMSDPYDRKKEMAFQQWQNSKKKMAADAPMFRSMSHGSKTFNKDINIYGEDNKAQQLRNSRRARSQSNISKFPHETKFKLARRGHGDTIGGYPKYIQVKTSEVSQTFRKTATKEEGKQSWKPNKWGLTRPTPSISYNPINLKLGKFK